MADSDDEIPIFGPMSRAVRAVDSDDDTPLFGPMSRAAKMQNLCPAPFTADSKDYLKEEVAGLSQEELNVVAVDEAEFRICVAESLANTPLKPELNVSQSFSEQEDVAREDAARRAAAIITSFGKGTIKIRKCDTLKLNGCNRIQFI